MTQSIQRVGVGLVVGLIALFVVRTLAGALWGGFSFLVFLFGAVAVFDVVTSRRSVGGKTLWVAFIVFAPIVGAIAYWFLADGD